MSEYKKVLQIAGPKNTLKYLELISHLAIKNHVQIKAKEFSSGTVFESDEIRISCLPMSHGAPSLAYSFEIKEKRRLDKNKLKKLKLPNSPLLKKLAEGKDIVIDNKKIKSSSVSYIEKGRKITFILDTAPNANTIKLAKNSDILISEASFSNEEEKLASEYLHLTAKQAAEIAKKAKCKSLILTHISQRYENSPEVILKEAKAVFKNTSLAFDLQKFEI